MGLMTTHVKLIINRKLLDSTIISPFTVEAWETVGNVKDDDNGQDGDDDDNIYKTQMASRNAEGCTIIEPYINTFGFD